jgi:Flp pilus assembly protein TadD
MKGPLNKLLGVVTRPPHDAQSWYALGTRAIESGELDEAGQALLRSVQLAPTETDRALSAGLTLLGAGRYAEAEQIMRIACDQAPARADVQIGLARIQIGSGRSIEAIDVLDRVLKVEPRSIDAHLAAASACEALGRLVDAADHLALVLAADAQNVDAARRLVDVLGGLGDTRGLIRALKRMVDLTGGQDFDVLVNLGITLSSVGRHAEAIEVLEDVATRRRDVSSAYGDLGLALLTAGRLDEANTAMQRALSLDPRSAQAYCGVGLCYQQMGRLKEAAQAFASTEELAPELAVGPMNLGLVLDALGDKTGARRALLRAAALEPADQEIQAALERLFSEPPSGDPRRTTAEIGAAVGAIAGDLSSVALLDLVEFLRLQRRSGRLALTSRRGAASIDLYQGQITSATVPETKRFDQALIEARLISRSNLEAALTRAGHRDRESAESLATVLIQGGALESRPVAQLLSRRIHDALTKILTWTEGTFSFLPEEYQAPPAIFFNLQDVMVQLVRMSDERMQGIQGPAR